MNYSHLLYKRGYLFSEAEVEPPVATWTQKSIGGYFISFDPENPWAFSQRGNNWVALLGKVIDTLSWNMDVQAVVSQCLDLLSHSEEKMLDYIDYLSGRFIIIYHHGNMTKLMTDAFGTRTAFYSLHNQVLVTSHCKIIGDLLNSNPCTLMDAIRSDPRWQYLPNYGYPGNLTQYEGIYVLTPNTLINIEGRRIQRFYPRRQLPAGDVFEVADQVSVMLKRQLELLHTKYNLVLSLSAGIDSRTTLAVARDIATDVLFFTHGKHLDTFATEASGIPDRALAAAVVRQRMKSQRTIEIDLSIASEIAQTLGLRHICIDRRIDDKEDFEQLSKVLDCNTHSLGTYHALGRNLAGAYLAQLPQNALHIRSNVNEVSRAFYRKGKLKELPPLMPDSMALRWKRMENNDLNKLVVEAFRGFAEVSEFANILNYDPYDMFYWEHRMGTWLASSLLATDVVFDTHIPFNCRTIAERMLSVPLEERMASAVPREIINRLWPVLLQWPINAPSFKLQVTELWAEHDRLRSQLRSVRNSFSFQLGNILVRAVVSPGHNTILLPYRLIRLCITGLKRWKAVRAKGAKAD